MVPLDWFPLKIWNRQSKQQKVPLNRNKMVPLDWFPLKIWNRQSKQQKVPLNRNKMVPLDWFLLKIWNRQIKEQVVPLYRTKMSTPMVGSYQKGTIRFLYIGINWSLLIGSLQTCRTAISRNI